MPAAELQIVLDLHMAGIPNLVDGNYAVGPIAVGEQASGRSVREAVVPAREHVAAANQIGTGQQGLGRAGPGKERDIGLKAALIHSALEAEIVPVRKAGIRADSALREIPGIIGVAARRAYTRLGIAGLSKDPVGEALSDAIAVADAGTIAFLVTGRGFDGEALGLLRGLRHDVDDSIDRVGSPERAARTADDLDAVYIVQWHVLQ